MERLRDVEERIHHSDEMRRVSGSFNRTKAKLEEWRFLKRHEEFICTAVECIRNQ